MSIFYGYEENEEREGRGGTFNTIFNLNVDKSHKAGDVEFNGTRVKMIRNGQSILSQSKRSMQPEIGGLGVKYISSIRGDGVKCAMHYYLPRAQYMNIHYFFVGVKLGRVNNIYFDSLINNDSGSWSRFVAYKSGSDTRLSFGGAYPTSELTGSFSGDVGVKHLISTHWQNGVTHCRFNGTPISGGLHNANSKKHGSAYGTIFANWRGTLSYNLHSNVQFYGMKIVEGYMTEQELSGVCGDIMKEYNIN